MTIFWILAAVLVFSALLTITARRPVHSVIGLLVHFAALAGLYLSLSAEFIAVVQILVYSGAILVLFVFVIALLSSGVEPFRAGPDRLPRLTVPAIAAAAIGCALAAWSGVHAALSPVMPAVSGPVGAAGVFGSVDDFGQALFGRYLLPFEVTALVLMVAVIGVVMLAGDLRPESSASKRGKRSAANVSEREPILKVEA